ncbi:DUF6415 family natural product biosynthesis protein [Streptomyces sp. NPDC051677]|uniref:DUF6415 family natural product biosynthesis protein n=1 Tax=Streptomyces sp. NPDC051677 TaxID=3365669 RepID=UPI0037D744CD
MQTTTSVPSAEEQVQDPPDIATMRETAGILLDPDAVALAPAAGELDKLTRMMRGHLELLIPKVERVAGKLEEGSPARHCALACLGEASRKLRTEAAPTPDGPLTHARRLARVLNALCEHYEQSGGERP